MDRISELPKDILQRILYFLPQGEAVRTSVLSKSWRYSWCTRSNLDFSDAVIKGNKQEFISVVDKNLQRYCDRRMFVEEFYLRSDLDEELFLLLEKWIPLLTVMGLKKFRLSLCSERSWEVIHLPLVVFEAESLHDLRVETFKLDRTTERVVLSKHLRKLHLEKVYIEDDTFQHIISRCPLMIESMSLESCEGLRNIKVDNLRYLKNFCFYKRPLADEDLCSIDIYPPSLKTIENHCGNLKFHRGADFRNLKYLYLFRVKSSLDQYSSCKFPSLKTLIISDCDGLKEIKLFLDAPNMVDFTYRGDFVPFISIATTSKKWKSDIDMTYPNYGTSSRWFVKLKELLKSLSQSRISLCIDQYSIGDDEVVQENNNLVQDNGCDKSIVVSSLSILCDLSPITSFLIYGALSICRPRYIGDYVLRSRRELIKCLWMILVQEVDDQFENALWLQDLEEVSMEIYGEHRKGWHPITLSELPNEQEAEVILVRFLLKWRENDNLYHNVDRIHDS